MQAVKEGKGYRMRDKELKILCYAGDAFSTAGNEDDLQTLATNSTQQ